MANTAVGVFRVEFYDSYWIIWNHQGARIVITSKAALIEALSRKFDDFLFAQAEEKRSRLETTEEFLARGGIINKVKARREPPVTLVSLGLIEPEEISDPDE